MAQLSHRVGLRHVELVEDAVQAALATALTAWVVTEVPREPGAWLHRAACNHLLGALRREAGRLRLLEAASRELELAVSAPPAARFADEVDDDLLRMMFVCCDDAIPRESRVVLALKTLCGFSTAEIALRLFTSEANVHKRLARARQKLREGSLDELTSPPLDALRGRVSSVHEVIYLLFNEGYLSVRADAAIRAELCDEAVRLATLLAEHPVVGSPESAALVALMHLHAARFPGRVDGEGGMLLLEEQDRALWDRARLARGAEWLARASTGDVFSRYHAEAGIAAEHGFAPSFGATRWGEIVELYTMLDRVAPSPLHTLNRAVAIAEWQGPAAALAALGAVSPPLWLEDSCYWRAVLADLTRRVGDVDAFERHRARAIATAPSNAVRTLLQRRLG